MRLRRYWWLVGLGFALAVVAMVLGWLIAIAPVVIGGVLATSGRRNAGIAIVVTTLLLVGGSRLVVVGFLGGHSYPPVKSESMAPTLRIGDTIVGIDDDSPRRGDLYTHREPFQCGVPPRLTQPCPTPGPTIPGAYVHRIVALPGEHVKVVANRAYVNGRRLGEPYVNTQPCANQCDLPDEITVPADHYFVMGDNRGDSLDSRTFGPVPKDWLLKRVWFRSWPLDRLEFL